ncbi:Zn-dependent hydrolase, RNA-metabolising [Richelia intracellularis HH01]|uniref:Ribonuclease J n=1 Tax=Richelia intracellularis HH01 TaxID=1165094 RepID=M1X0P6_9NOST|nr:ribonuclease J [Richelia intracellularis]CCH68417.1 Zn-dependent hydrolase, RNA-metabolising [Richelia intracellularis HH01]HAE06329.1 RNase J family beta-CASP ribonuclease [Richelia sp.]
MAKKENKSTLKIIPLGGLHEIGKNTCVFEYEDEILLLDAGLAFPTDGMHGVNIVLPDTTYLRENSHKIKGMIVTHGHEDHIGGIAFHLKQFDIPVICGPRLAMAMLEGKLEEAGVRDRTKINTVMPRDIVRIGKSFVIEYIRNTHSMADSFTVAILTPLGVVIHTGDFKFDHTPVDGEHFDLQKLAEHGEKGVLCLMSDSTNSEVTGFTPSERSVYPNLERIFCQSEGRLFVTTFASSVHRINMILQLAEKHNRTVSIVGRSMLNLIAHARNLNYIKCDDNLLKPLHMVRNLPDENILILTTGSQGEHMAALSRIARKEHPHINIREGDTVVFSANPIPGNTIAVVNTIDKLMMQGAKVIYGRNQGVHVSGHGCQEDQKLMIALTRPKFFLPVHGEHRMLVKHSETAQSMGIPRENIVIIDNGNIVELAEESIKVLGKVPSGIELVDTSSSGMVSAKVLQERQVMANEGIVTIATAIDWSGKLLAKPEIHLRGVVTCIEKSLLQKLVQQRIEESLSLHWQELSHCVDNGDSEVDWSGLEGILERELIRFLKRELQCQPNVTLLIQIPEAPAAKVTDGRRRRTRTTAQVAS